MKKFIITFCFALFSMVSFSADDFTLWPTTTVGNGTDALAGGVIATSSTISNNNLKESGEFIVNFKTAKPDQCNSEPADYKLFLKVEGNINGIWIPLGVSFSKYNNCDDATQRIVIIGPNVPNLDFSDFVIPEGNKNITKISYNIGNLTNQIRVAIRLEQGSNAPLTQLTFDGLGRFY